MSGRLRKRIQALFGLLLATAVCCLPAEAGAQVSPNRVPGLERLPWVPMEGGAGDWVRYRVGNHLIQETSYMTLALVELEEDGAVWLEIKISRTPRSATGDLSVKALARYLDGDMVTERMLVRVAGGKTVELDLSTVPESESGDEASFGGAGACVEPDSAACKMAADRGLDVQRRPAETMMTAAGSMRVVPVQVRLSDGYVTSFLVSESVPVTGLVAANTFDGTSLELDGMGGGAEPMMPKTAELVTYDELGDALYRGGAAGGALSRVGQLVNPDEARREEEARRAEEARQADAAASAEAPENRSPEDSGAEEEKR